MLTEDNIREALGIQAMTGRWREIYPCAFAVSFFRGTYRDYGPHQINWSYVDWIDLADMLLAVPEAEQS